MIRTRTVIAKGNAWFSLIPPPFRGQLRSIISDDVTFVFSSFGSPVLDFSGLSGPVGQGAENVNAAALRDG